MDFVSKANKSIHKEYLRQLRLRLSIFEKSYPWIKGKNTKEIARGGLKSDERDELIRLKGEILAHEIYFSSFGESSGAPSLRKEYGSEASFLYNLFCEAKKCRNGGFLLIYIDKRGKINSYIGNDYYKLFDECVPCLAIDLCEHAFFYDYLFEREKYIKSAISRLNLSKIENMVEKAKQ